MSQQLNGAWVGKAVVILDLDRSVVAVRYVASDGQTWVFAGPMNQKLQLLREVGKEAANLMSSFTWMDAAIVSEAIRQHWPNVDSVEAVPVMGERCNCHACRCRREDESELEAM